MKNKVLIQALILGVGQVGGKILSLIFLFRLAQDFQGGGLYLYTYAYVPFSLFLDLSAFGLIPGVAKCVARLYGGQKENKIRYMLKSGSIFCIFIGIIFFILLNIFNEKILAVSLYKGYTTEEYTIILKHLKIASLSLLIYPITCFYKGYIQGHLRMLPSALSILLENMVRVVLYLVISKNISIGVMKQVFYINFISYASSLLFLFFFVVRDYFKEKEKYPAILDMLKIALPFGMVTLFFTFFQFIDTVTLPSLGLESRVYTAYMFETIRLIFIPIVLSQSVGGALNPKINALYSKHKEEEARGISINLTRIMIYLLIPIVCIYQIYAKELYLFFYKDASLSYILSDVSLFIFFIGFYKVIIGISQGMKEFKYIVVATFLSLAAKIILNIMLVPQYNAFGAVLSTIFSISISLLVSYYVLHRAGICLFFKNCMSVVSAVTLTILSCFFATIFRLAFLLQFTPIVQMVLFCICMILIYILFLSGIRIYRVSKASRQT